VKLFSPTPPKAPPAEKPQRKVLGFYFDLDGQIQIMEEGLNETEKMAMLLFIEHYAFSQGRQTFAEIRKRAMTAETEA